MSTSYKVPTGKLYTSNVSGLRRLNANAEIWQITRSGITIPKAVLVRNLSPSPELYNTYLNEWKHLTPKVWWHKYEERFLNELKTDDKLNCLREIYKKLFAGINIVLVCFCRDHNYCHRKLVGEFFIPYGIIAQELNPIQTEQLSLILE